MEKIDYFKNKNNVKTDFRKYVDFIKANFFILYKKLLEYKINLWSSILLQIVFLSVNLFFVLIISSNFGDIIGWDNYDFLLLVFLSDIIWVLTGIFLWSRPLFYEIKKGYLNVIINKPLSNLFKKLFLDLNESAFVMLILDIPFLMFILLFILKINILKILFLILIIFYLSFFILIFVYFLESFDFYYLGLGESLRKFINIFEIVDSYPYQFFKNFKFRFIFLIFSITYVSFIIPYIRGYEPLSYLLKYLLISFILFIIFFIGTVYNWKRGIKKYEAYG